MYVPRFTHRRIISLLLCLLLVAVACTTVKMTGRRQMLLVPRDTMLSMSFQQYGGFLQENPPITEGPRAAMVERAGRRIQRAVETYFTQKGWSSDLDGYQWEFNLVESEEVNAWCMPGGKVVVYSGILDLAGDEAGLAVVMGHEIAHAVARHGNERMSQGLVVQMGGMALAKALEEKPEETRQLWLSAFGLGAQLGVMLPYSRSHESEADHMGLIFMAMAGYDPHRAVSFWEQMAQAKGGSAPPEFLSTHPSDATRIRDLRAQLPEALQYYQQEP